MDKIGGYESMVNQFIKSASRETYLEQALHNNRSCGFPPDDAYNIFRGMDSDYPWPGLVFGLTLLATYYWCTQQVKKESRYSLVNLLICTWCILVTKEQLVKNSARFAESLLQISYITQQLQQVKNI